MKTELLALFYWIGIGVNVLIGIAGIVAIRSSRRSNREFREWFNRAKNNYQP